VALKLWLSGKIVTKELWTFAYEDGNKEYYPRPEKGADVFIALTENNWHKKYVIITQKYGFTPESWEAKTTPIAEAFRKYTDPSEIVN
jgi:hypothetical protein